MRVFIIDGHIVFREGLSAVLNDHRDFTLAGCAADLTTVLAEPEGTPPDIYVVDFVMAGGNPARVTETLRLISPESKVLLLTASAVVQHLIEGFSAGALGYVLKSEPVAGVMTAIRRVGRGQPYVSPSLQHIFERLRRSRFPATVLGVLSERERLVFNLVTAGRSTIEIAEQLSVSRKTVETHKYRIMRKLGVSGTGELIRYAALQDLLPPPLEPLAPPLPETEPPSLSGGVAAAGASLR
jgi:two-component system response regulator NreC